ncbi:thiolase family protein, partial [Chloroflexota bacterium]
MNGKALASIVSAGCSKFGKREGLTSRELFVEAFREVLEHCPNIDPKKDIKALFIGHVYHAYEKQGHLAVALADWVGLTPKPATRFENACASSSVALRYAVTSIMAGLYDIVLVGGAEKITTISGMESQDISNSFVDFPMEQWNGISLPAVFAMAARAHMHKYGTTEKQMALVAVKNHEHGMLNPKAAMHVTPTVDDVMSSRIISTPIKLYDCTQLTDGASCLVLTRPDIAESFTSSPVDIIGMGQSQESSCIAGREDLHISHAAVRAAREAYEMADVSPDQIDLAEVHDCFTIGEILAYEALGFCDMGKGGQLIEEGATYRNARMPVNTDGGLKSKGHPVGATGAAQVYEIYLQLTGQGGDRQLP